jgi:S-DNA-T family DNA segregation ATPase FtsK/SpoIIIE
MNIITSKDQLYIKAKSIVIRDKNCSTSYLQRKLEIGYNRAGVIMKQLEQNGTVSPPDKNGIRKITQTQE